MPAVREALLATNTTVNRPIPDSRARRANLWQHIEEYVDEIHRELDESA